MSQQEPSPRVFAIIPTYRRDAPLASQLQALASQTVVPDRVLVVDNAGTESCRRVCVDADSSFSNLTVEYMDAGSNLGPAGAMALGVPHLLEGADDRDWILRCDDDSPPDRDDLLENRLQHANELRSADSRVAGVGGGGSRFNYRRCRLVKPPSGGEGAHTAVDYLATNRWPLFSAEAMRVAGGFRADLFFGLSEVDFGLRLRKRGYRLYRIDSDVKRRPSTVSHRLGVASWRRYYSVRNMVVIAREYCGWTATFRVVVVRVLLKPLVNFPFEPINSIRHIRLGLKAVRDAFQGRMGRTVEPTLSSGKLDVRWEPQVWEG